MSKDDKMGESRAAAETARDAINDAIAAWRNAPENDKPEKAYLVLSQVGGRPGVKLENVTDAATAAEIRADYKKRKK